MELPVPLEAMSSVMSPSESRTGSSSPHNQEVVCEWCSSSWQRTRRPLYWGGAAGQWREPISSVGHITCQLTGEQVCRVSAGVISWSVSVWFDLRCRRFHKVPTRDRHQVGVSTETVLLWLFMLLRWYLSKVDFFRPCAGQWSFYWLWRCNLLKSRAGPMSRELQRTSWDD